MKPLDPGDVHVPELEAVLFGLEEMRAMALEGYSRPEIARANGWRQEDVRRAEALLGFSLSPIVTRQELCPVCGYLLMPDGHCQVCTLNRRLERALGTNAREEMEEVARLMRDINAVKADTRRMRDARGEAAAAEIVSAVMCLKPHYLANPRKRRHVWQAFEAAATALLDAFEEEGEDADN